MLLLHPKTHPGGCWFLFIEIQIYGAITTSLKSVVIHGRPMASFWGNATPCCPTGHRSQPKMAFLQNGHGRIYRLRITNAWKGCWVQYSSYLFLNFLLPHPASPISPVPRRSIVEGSGTAEGEVPVRVIE